MVLAYHGRKIDPGWLRRVLESTPIGTSGFKTLNLAQHGYAVRYAPATDERALLDALAAGTPPIVLLLTTYLHYWETDTAHAVVVVGVESDEMIVNDPAFAKQSWRVPHNEFMLAWSDFDYLYALVELGG
jgi:ABC-type bacteriocin/lantibiotic exporter with double-glycine peptidase domain